MNLLPILESLRDFDTALLANTIGYIDPTPPEEYYTGRSIQSVTPSLAPTVGVAVTCDIDTSTPGATADTDAYYRQLDEISRMNLPAVWVAKTAGSKPDHECVLGDGMGKSLFAAGCQGVITDGGVRDVVGLLSIPFAAYCAGTTIHHCALRVRSCGEPIAIGGITVHPGDVVHANAEGVIRISGACLETLAGRAVQMRAFEHAPHWLLRRTDLNSTEKRQAVGQLLATHGFSN